MIYKPHDYQIKAKEFIIDHPYAGLLLDMGLGKTSITLTAINELIYDRFEVERVLVIAPPTVAEDTWSGEALKWEHLKHLKVSVCLGNEKKRMAALNTDADIFVLSNAVVPWLVDYMKQSGLRFDMLVIDELSAFKSSNSNRFRALKRMRKTFDRVVGLTGTPAPNGLIDLWPQIFLLDMGEALGKTITRYRQSYFYPAKQNGHIVYEWGLKDGSEELIYEKLNPFCLSMKNVDYLDMPKRVDNFVEVRLNKKEREVYNHLKREYCLSLGGTEITAANAAVLSGKLLQMDSGAIYDDAGEVIELHHRKLDALKHLIEEANGKPVIVVYNYKHSLFRLSEALTGDLRVRVYKDASDKEDWNNGRIDVLLIHPKSCKYGLNLQHGGSTLIWFDLTWSLDDYLQTNARIWRQGQDETVVIHHIVCKGTMDEKVVKALQGKDKTQNALLRAIKAEIKSIA